MNQTQTARCVKYVIAIPFDPVPFPFIAEVFTTMAQANQHTYQLLTKRPRRLREFYEWNYPKDKMSPDAAAEDWLGSWPNVWYGTSCENQATADVRVPLLLSVPGSHYVSFEPLLGPIDVPLHPPTCPRCGNEGIEGLRIDNTEPFHWYCNAEGCRDAGPLESLDWAIVGCESNGQMAGRGADDYPFWADAILSRCKDVGVPAYHKQMPINGRVSHDPAFWPERLRVREEMPQ